MYLEYTKTDYSLALYLTFILYFTIMRNNHKERYKYASIYKSFFFSNLLKYSYLVNDSHEGERQSLTTGVILFYLQYFQALVKDCHTAGFRNSLAANSQDPSEQNRLSNTMG